jgi:hypothetical protein
MDKEQISVFVNDRPVKIYRGMAVKHAFLALDQTLFDEAQDGQILVRDDQGFIVGLDGALHDGARLYAKKAKGKKGFKDSRGQGKKINEKDGKTASKKGGSS